MTEEKLHGSLANALRQPHRGTSLFWLGQAGFLLRLEDRVVLIDPYLSDSLAEKYRGQRFEHKRMMPSPIVPSELPRCDLVLCTHRHSDHMDPGTLPVLSRDHPDCRFVVPAAELKSAKTLGLCDDRLVPAVAGMTLRLLGIDIMPVSAAHERLETDDAGQDRFLGYKLAERSTKLYHSGDCIPYEGLGHRLRELRIRLALLPVNGRDSERAGVGVPGNFTLDEAVSLCREVEIPTMIAHHWGMFDFNSCDPATIEAQAATSTAPVVVRPSPDRFYRLD